MVDQVAGVGKAGEHVGIPQGNLPVAAQADLGQDGQRGAFVVLAGLLQLPGVEVKQGRPTEEHDGRQNSQPFDGERTVV